MLYVVRGKKREKVASNVKIINSFFGKGSGLMFRRKIVDEAYVFTFDSERFIAITMMFVFFSIDLIFLDRKRKVVEVKSEIRPFSNYVPKLRSVYVVEVPAETVARHKIKIGDKLEF